ncbi:PocR ligand-binding domain-containing protein [Alishewanella tabrizica]|nr:PocR ligand-binding domain-containing protein [Alishewanella tabrizica]
MNSKAPHLHREANLIQMFDPLTADWNITLSAQNTLNTHQVLANIDFGRLSTLFDSFLQVLHIPIALVDLQGKVLASSAWQRACHQFHRQAPTTLQGCLESDRELALQLQQGKNYSLYRCRNGLTDCATPIMLEGKHVANLFMGQFFLQTPDEQFFKHQAQHAGFAESDYLAALADVPIVDEAKLPAMINMLASLAVHIAELVLLNNRYLQVLEQSQLQIEQRNQELQLQNHILNQISEGVALKTILYHLVSQVEQLHPDMICSILLLDEDGKTLRHGAAPSLPERYNLALDGVVSGIGVGSCGTAAFSGETVIVSDTRTHPYWQPYQALAQLAGIAACWSQPIKNAQGKVLGTFAMYHKHPAEPTPHQIEKIRGYSNLAELAISRSISAQQIRRLAFYDSLTGLANRRLLEEHLSQAMAASQHNETYCCLMFIDMDDFKPVNDRYGHKAGDTVLAEVARRLTHSLHLPGTVARFGGDEFVVLIRDIEQDVTLSMQQIEDVISKIRQQLLQPYLLPNGQFHQCGCSIGMTLFKGAANMDTLLLQADTAMYQAKNQQVPACWFNA